MFVLCLQAKALDLVDQVVEKDQLLPAAEKVMQMLVKLPPLAVAGTKRSLREDFCAAWEKYYVVEPEGAWALLNQPDTLRTLGGAMQRLSGGKANGGAPAANQSKL